MSHEEDLLEDVKVAINDNAVKSIASVVAEYDALEHEKEACDQRSAEIGKALNALKMETLPELLKAAGTSSLTDAATGRVIEMEMLVAGGLVKGDLEKRAAQLAYLREMGAESLIKTKVTIEFDKGDEETTQAVIAYMKDGGFGDIIAISEDVHSGSLAAWGRERIRHGQELEAEKCGLFITNFAIPKVPVVKKVKVKARAI